MHQPFRATQNRLNGCLIYSHQIWIQPSTRIPKVLYMPTQTLTRLNPQPPRLILNLLRRTHPFPLLPVFLSSLHCHLSSSPASMLFSSSIGGELVVCCQRGACPVTSLTGLSSIRHELYAQLFLRVECISLCWIPFDWTHRGLKFISGFLILDQCGDRWI